MLLASKLILPGLLQDANTLAVLGAFMLLGFMIKKLYRYILIEYLFILGVVVLIQFGCAYHLLILTLCRLRLCQQSTIVQPRSL